MTILSLVVTTTTTTTTIKTHVTIIMVVLSQLILLLSCTTRSSSVVAFAPPLIRQQNYHNNYHPYPITKQGVGVDGVVSHQYRRHPFRSSRLSFSKSSSENEGNATLSLLAVVDINNSDSCRDDKQTDEKRKSLKQLLVRSKYRAVPLTAAWVSSTLSLLPNTKTFPAIPFLERRLRTQVTTTRSDKE
jgi:hypothetical protein